MIDKPNDGQSILRLTSAPVKNWTEALRGVPYTFSERPVPVDPEYRTIWRISVLLLSLRICARGNKASIKQVHVLNWAVLTPESRRRLLEVLEGHRRPGDMIVQVEPSLSRACTFAEGEGLVAFVGNNARLSLTPSGERAAQKIQDLPDCLRQEKEFFQEIGRKVTDSWVSQLFVAGLTI